MKILSCLFNMNTACVELRFEDGTMIAIDTIAVEDAIVKNLHQQSELDYLIYNGSFGVRRTDFKWCSRTSRDGI